MKTLVAAFVLGVASLASGAPPYPAAEAGQKRFVMQFRQYDGSVSGVELITARAEDENILIMMKCERGTGRR